MYLVQLLQYFESGALLTRCIIPHVNHGSMLYLKITGSKGRGLVGAQ